MCPALQAPWTEEQFLVWADAQAEPYEFDGVRPMAMPGRNIRHDIRYVIVDSASPTVQCLHRTSGADPWTLTPLDTADSLKLPEAGIEIQVEELYATIEFPALPGLE